MRTATYRSTSNFYRYSYKRYDRISEDGSFGTGTEAALREVVAHHNNGGTWGGTTTTANVEVSKEWYGVMLEQMRTAGWQPYGEAAPSQAPSQSPAQQTHLRSRGNPGGGG